MGLCNGVRLIVSRVVENSVVFLRFSAMPDSESFPIPRISLIVDESNKYPFNEKRQFPIKQAFSLTINKVQGQTLKRVSVWLEDPVSSHGQFYVTASRISEPTQIRSFVENSEEEPRPRNIVYSEVLS